MNATLETEISRLTKKQKLALADRLLTDAGLHAKPPGLRSIADPELAAELHRRLGERARGTWLTGSEFRRRTGLR
jgi:hypothetical protein